WRQQGAPRGAGRPASRCARAALISRAMSALASVAPTPPRIPQIRLYQDWLRTHRGLSFDSYDALWRWSVEDLPAFWGSVWECFGIQSPTPFSDVLADDRMPGAVWFPGAQVNYARQVLRH